MLENLVNEVRSNSGMATGAAAATIITGAAFQVGSIIHENIAGEVYSDDEKQRMIKLKRLYQEVLQKQSPVTWELDDKNRPTHRIKNQKWSLHVRQLRQAEKKGHYHYQSSMITDYASTYLMKRGSRWLGKGKPGDLVEQFIGEWIDFAINDLPTLGFDDISVKKIKQRISYLDKVQKNEFIFKFGSVTRNKNKLDTIESIRQQLKACISIAEQESLRQCAREKLDVCRSDISVMLLSCVQTIYYARKTDVYHEPLELSHYIEFSDEFLTSAAKEIYPKIKNTHTGAMLEELISMAGLNSFGTLGENDDNCFSSRYFGEGGTTKKVNWTGLEHDLPPWVEKKFIDRHLSEFQSLGECILRVAGLKQLVENAYDLTGKIGDLWAYGDRQGKLSLKAILFLLEKEIKLLNDRYDHLYDYHNTQRHAYNLKNRINPNGGVNPNFNKVDDQKANIDTLYLSIKSASQSIREQMDKFPEDSPKRIDTQKKKFYKSIAKYLEQFHPDYHSEFNLLNENIDLVDTDENVETTGSHTVEMIGLTEEVNLKWPIRQHPHESKYFYLDKPEFRSFFNKDKIDGNSDMINTDWKIGGEYNTWSKFFFVHKSNEFSIFQRLSENLQIQTDNPSGIDDINLASTSLCNHVAALKDRIAHERPAWRFKLAIWPIVTYGWPFHREANTFADLLIAELNGTINHIERAVLIAKNKMARNSNTNNITQKLEKGLNDNQPIKMLDKIILNSIKKNGGEKKKYVIQLDEINRKNDMSQTDHGLARNNNTLSIHKEREQANNRYNEIQLAFSNIQNKCGKFQIFRNKSDTDAILNDILRYRDHLPKDLQDPYVNSWGNFGYQINLEAEYPDDVLDDDCYAQMILAVKMIEIMKTDPNTNERNSFKNIFISEADKFFKKQEACTNIHSLNRNSFYGSKKQEEYSAPSLQTSTPKSS